MKRWIRYTLVTLILCITVPVMSIALIGWYLAPHDAPTLSDAIVVISGGGSERLEHGIELYNQGIAPRIILSGAARESDYSNAEAMKAIAINRFSIPASALITEEVSTNTLENASEVDRILSDLNLHSITLVTSSYHQRRAYRTFHHVLGNDIDIHNAPAEVTFWQPLWWWNNEKGRRLTLTEFAKIGWSIFTGQYG